MLPTAASADFMKIIKPGVARGVQAIRWHGRKFPKSNSVYRAGVTTWPEDNAAELLKHTKQCQWVWSRPVAPESEEEMKIFAPIWTPNLARGAPVVKREEHNPSLTV